MVSGLWAESCGVGLVAVCVCACVWEGRACTQVGHCHGSGDLGQAFTP